MRVNTISAGPLASRAAKAIGTIDRMVEYYEANAALPKRTRLMTWPTPPLSCALH